MEKRKKRYVVWLWIPRSDKKKEEADYRIVKENPVNQNELTGNAAVARVCRKEESKVLKKNNEENEKSAKISGQEPTRGREYMQRFHDAHSESY